MKITVHCNDCGAPLDVKGFVTEVQKSGAEMALQDRRFIVGPVTLTYTIEASTTHECES